VDERRLQQRLVVDAVRGDPGRAEPDDARPARREVAADEPIRGPARVELADPGRQRGAIVAAADHPAGRLVVPVGAVGAAAGREDRGARLHGEAEHLRAAQGREAHLVGQRVADQPARRAAGLIRCRAQKGSVGVLHREHHPPGHAVEPLVADDAVAVGRGACRERRVARGGLGQGVRVGAIVEPGATLLETREPRAPESGREPIEIVGTELIQHDEDHEPRRRADRTARRRCDGRRQCRNEQYENDSRDAGKSKAAGTELHSVTHGGRAYVRWAGSRIVVLDKRSRPSYMSSVAKSS
jgi:hypothetical protein